MKNNLICIGTGLVALDVVIGVDEEKSTRFYAGGSCGNVLTILAYMGWQSYPIARLSNNVASDQLIQDLNRWAVKEDLLTFTSDGSTPIIIHRILKDKAGLSKHRFEFRNPEDGKYLPSYKPCLSKAVPEIIEKGPVPKVFYFDRVNRASIELAKSYKANGAIIFFEPSSMKEVKGFMECLQVADVVKFANDRLCDFDRVFNKAIAQLEIQTLGERGLKYRRRGEESWIKIQGYSINNVIDTAGAGDWCTAGIVTKLFSEFTAFSDITEEHIQLALNFGQILSAVNCTFEGARGTMYNMDFQKLSLIAKDILKTKSNAIPLENNHPFKKKKTVSTPIKISSLFVHSR